MTAGSGERSRPGWSVLVWLRRRPGRSALTWLYCRPGWSALAWLRRLTVVALLGGAAAAQDTVATVAQLRTVAALGGTYTVAAGTFEVMEPIEVTRDLELIGQGASATVFGVGAAPVGLRVTNGATVRMVGFGFSRLTNESPSSDLIHVVDGHLELVDVRLANAKSGDTHPLKGNGLGTALYLTGGSTASLTDVTFARNGLAAVEIVDRASLVLRDSTLIGNAYGIYVTDDATLTIESSRFENTTANAITAQGRATVTVSDTLFVANGTTVDISGFEYDAVRIGFEATGAFARNEFRGNPRFALSIYGTAEVRTEDNYFENNGGFDASTNLYSSALMLEERSVLESHRDRFFANPGGAIELSGSASGAFLSTTVERTGSFASVYGDSSGTARFVDLTAVDNEGCICVYAGTVIFEGGTLARNGGEAIFAYGVATLVVTGVTILDHPMAAISTYETASVTITANTLTNNAGGIYIGPDSEATVTDNSIEGGGTYGAAIAFHASASGVISGNRVRQAAFENAIEVHDPSRVTIDGNDVGATD